MEIENKGQTNILEDGKLKTIIPEKIQKEKKEEDWEELQKKI